MKASGHTESLS